jgi:hypothetical protein
MSKPAATPAATGISAGKVATEVFCCGNTPGIFNALPCGGVISVVQLNPVFLLNFPARPDPEADPEGEPETDPEPDAAPGPEPKRGPSPELDPTVPEALPGPKPVPVLSNAVNSFAPQATQKV